MAQSPMYAAMVNSPGTELAADINATDTEITVLDASKLPAAPNLVTVGGDETAETIMYTGKTGNMLTGCTRGFEGTAKGWAAGSPAARNHTAYDYDAGRANISDLDERVSNIVIPDGSTTQKGIVQLSDAADGTRSTVASTEKAVNDARLVAATDATTKANAVQTVLDNHANTIVNSAAAHGLRINAGALEYYNGTAWVPQNTGPTFSTQRVDYYVNGSTGNDSNTGLEAGQAFKTIAKALSMVPYILNHLLIINVAAGTYTEDIIIEDRSGSGFLRIVGPSGGFTLNGKILVQRCTYAIVSLLNITVNTPANTLGVSLSYVNLAVINSLIITGSNSQAGISLFYATADVSACTISNRTSALYTQGFSQLYSNSNSGSGNNFGMQATGGSTIVKSGSQPAGTTAELVSGGGLIRS